jgi:1-acyl-sn-glycerol-3-phosphate acyltransferase
MQRTIFNTPLLSHLLRLLSLLLLKVLGWRIEGEQPAERKFVLIAAPHTSNWDAFYMIMVAFVFRINLYWMGKHTLFKGPFGVFSRFLGGIPINRSASFGMVDQSVKFLKNSSDIVLAIPPEGTRKKVPYWKSGFYHIASGAGVPIVTGFLDYGSKRSGVGPSLIPSGDMASDYKILQDFYAPMAGKYPRETSSIQMLEKN